MPGLVDQYPKLSTFAEKARAEGYKDDEIDNFVRHKFIAPAIQAGHSAEDVNRYLGVTGPTTMQKVATGPVGSAAEFGLSALSRLAPSHDVWNPQNWKQKPGESLEQAQARGKTMIADVMPRAVTDTFEGTINQVRKVSPALARIIEDSMAALPPVAGEFATPGKL